MVVYLFREERSICYLCSSCSCWHAMCCVRRHDSGRSSSSFSRNTCGCGRGGHSGQDVDLFISLFSSCRTAATLLYRCWPDRMAGSRGRNRYSLGDLVERSADRPQLNPHGTHMLASCDCNVDGGGLSRELRRSAPEWQRASSGTWPHSPARVCLLATCTCYFLAVCEVVLVNNT